MNQTDIREIREALGLSQEDLATVLEVTRLSVSRYENGQAKPGDTTLNKLIYLRDAVSSPDQRDYLRRLCAQKQEGLPSLAGLLAFTAALPLTPLPMVGLTLFGILKSPVGRFFARTATEIGEHK